MTSDSDANPNALERQILRLLLTVLAVFVYWTLAHQLATFAGVSWTRLQQATAWLLVPVVALSWLWSARVGSHLACGLAQRQGAPGTPAPATEPHTGTPAAAWAWLAVYSLIAAGLIVFVNRSDFDDAEYLQQAIQTLRYPDKPLYGFDASLGTLFEQFRFAPYRITSYETFVALVSSLDHIDLLDAYYLVLPTLWAVLSVAAAFLFLRWFLPRPWALLGVGLFLLIAITWGDTHVAYGNRMYVRLFQGKGLLVVLTTPLTVLMALLWMRRPSASTWVALLAMQVMAVGVSSSGIVVTLFATAIGIAAGWLARPGVRPLLHAAIGGAVLCYPVALGLWLKFASSAAGKVEDIGTYLPIEASLGGTARLALTLAVCAALLVLLARPMRRAWDRSSPAAETCRAQASLGWVLVASFVLVLNPFLIGYITEVTSRNMNWRLAWAAPLPLILAAGFAFLLKWAQDQRGHARLWAGTLAIGLPLAFALAAPPTLRASNHVGWGFWQHKLPPEHADAVALARQIRARADLSQPVTLLVEPRVGTWLTVVAPEFRLVMPGHGYVVTLQTILPAQEMADRVRLVGNVDGVVAGGAELLALARRYGVTVVAQQRVEPSRNPLAPYELIFITRN